MPSIIEELVSKVDMFTLAERAGAKFGHHNNGSSRTTCPLHDSKNPTAFHIWTETINGSEKQFWKCFTDNCGGGDALDFYKRWRNIPDVMDAVREMANEFNIQLNWREDPARTEADLKRRARYDLFDMATGYFQGQWHTPGGQQAEEYLHLRGLTDKTIGRLGFGYSDSGRGLAQYLTANGVSQELILQSGLVRADRNDFTANANGRLAAPYGYITIPYLVHGKTIYFSSRAVDILDPETLKIKKGKERPDPKDKSRNLPIDENVMTQAPVYRAEVQGCNEVILCEGLLDAASLWQMNHTAWGMAGLNKPPSADIEALKKRKAVYISTDADEAGQDKITAVDSRLVDMCNELGPLTMICPPMLEGWGKDFNDLLKLMDPARSETIRWMIAGATTWVEKRMQLAANCATYEREQRMQEIGKLLALVPSASKSFYVSRAQSILKINKTDIKALINQSLGRRSGSINSDIRDGQLFFMEEPMGNFWAKIQRELIVDNGQDKPEVKLEIIGGLDDDTDLPCIEIDASDFSGLTWVTRQWGALPVFYVSRKDYYKMIRAIQEVSAADLVREREYACTGWTRVDGQWSYLMSNGVLSVNGLDQEARVELGDSNLNRYQLPAPPKDSTGQIAAVRASLDFLKAAKRRVSAILWAAMYAAPLTSLSPLFAVLWVYGQTQTGKSTITMLALTHFGTTFIDDHKYHAPSEWLSSFAGLEDISFTLKDTTLVIDDYAPRASSKTEAALQKTTAETLIRTVGNRSAKRRSRNYEKHPRPPRGMVISTAENPLFGQSTVGRVIYVPVNKGDVIGSKTANDQLNISQAEGQKGLYAQAMALYIQWMAGRYDELAERIKNRSKYFVEEINKRHEIFSRLPDYYGVLAASQELALECFVDLHAITREEAEKISIENREALMDVIVQQSEDIGTESPVRKLFVAINAYLEQGKGYLAPRLARDFKPPTNQELIGWRDFDNTTTVWFQATTMLALAKRFWADLDENIDIHENMLKQQLDNAGVLNRDNDGIHMDKKVTIQGREARYLEVNAIVVERLFDIQLLPKIP